MTAWGSPEEGTEAKLVTLTNVNGGANFATNVRVLLGLVCLRTIRTLPTGEKHVSAVNADI